MILESSLGRYLRVYHVTDVFAPSIGGIETALATLLPILNGVQSTVLVDKREGSQPNGWSFGSVKVEPIATFTDWQRIWRSMIPFAPAERRQSIEDLLRQLSRASRRERLVSSLPKPDIIHFHGLGWVRRFNPRVSGPRKVINAATFYRIFRLAKSGKAAVYTDHSLFSGDYARFLANAGPAIADTVDAVVTVERSGFENAKRYLLKAGHNVLVRFIPNPIDLTTFHYSPPPQMQTFVLAYIGRSSKPGLDKVDAMWTAAPPWAHLVVCLADEETNSSRTERRAKLGAITESRNVDVRWNLSQEELAGLLARVHAVLDPYEVGTPRTSLEAMAVGRPVIRFRASQNEVEPMLPVELAPVVSSSRPEMAWPIVNSYRESFDRFAALTRACAAFAQNFEANDVARRYVSLYHELMEPKGG